MQSVELGPWCTSTLGVDATSGAVIFSDISTDLLDMCRELADHHGLRDRCHLCKQPPAILPLRSVLIYEQGQSRGLR